MAEGRILKKRISLNEAVADLANDTHRLLFTWTIPHLDVEGRITGSARAFKATVAPLLEHITPAVAEEFFTDAESKGLILRYQVDQEWCLQFRKFSENQNLRGNREAPSKIPGPPGDQESRRTPGVLREDSRSTPAEVKGREVKGREGKKSASPEPPGGGNGDPRPAAPAYVCECFEISKEYLAELCRTFAEVPEDYLLHAFFPAMRDWCLDNRKEAEHRGKFDKQGRLRNPRKCFRTWLQKESPEKVARWQPQPRARAPTELREPEGIVVPNPDCPKCKGKGGVMGEGPCDCLRPDKQP